MANTRDAGLIDPQLHLYDDTPGPIVGNATKPPKRHVRYIIDAMANGGYVLSTGDSMSPSSVQPTYACSSFEEVVAHIKALRDAEWANSRKVQPNQPYDAQKDFLAGLG